jgi:hypothetical protein
LKEVGFVSDSFRPGKFFKHFLGFLGFLKDFLSLLNLNP